MMARRSFLGIKFDDLEMRQIERAARELGMQKTSYARLMLLNGSLKSQQSQPGDLGALRDDLREMREALADIQSSLKESARLFNELLVYLRETQQAPSFYEYRVRCVVKNITRRDNETEMQYLLRVAKLYYLIYERWPDPADPSFGPKPKDFDPREWLSAPAQ
jgi:hypothetical protein